MSTTLTPEAMAEVKTDRRSRWRWLWIPALVAGVGIAVIMMLSSDNPPSLANGGFETGDLEGWTTDKSGSGEWLVYEDGTTPPKPSISDPSSKFSMPDPPEGKYAAVTDMRGEGLRILYRDIAVNGPWTLHAIVFYENQAYDQQIDTPSYLGGQQFRIDLIDPEARLLSTTEDDVLATVFHTQIGDPNSLGPTPVSIDLAPWEGRTVRLRIAQADNNGPMRAGIDDVRIDTGD